MRIAKRLQSRSRRPSAPASKRSGRGSTSPCGRERKARLRPIHGPACGRRLPHVEAMIRDLGERYGIVELAPVAGNDIASVWARHGLPSEHVSISDIILAQEAPAVRLMPWVDCCRIVRWEPVARFLAAQAEPALVLHGQRLEDGLPGNGMDAFPCPAHVEILSPLRDWSTDHVMAFVRERDVQLPSHYPEMMDSLDCWVCPANWMIPGKGDYARWMTREHPDLAAVVRPGVQRIAGEMKRRVDRIAAGLTANEG